MARSDFFERMMNGNWAKSDTKTVTFPDDDPGGVALYLEPFYTGKIGTANSRSEKTTAQFASIGGGREARRRRLNLVMHGIFAQMRTVDEEGNTWYPNNDAIATIYEGTDLKANQLRRFLVDGFCTLRKTRSALEWVAGSQKLPPKDFPAELALESLGRKANWMDRTLSVSEFE